MKALVFEHAEHEGAGLIGRALEAAGLALDVRGLDRGAPLPDTTRGYDFVLGLGGAMDAWDDAGHPWLAGEARLLAEAARAGRPTLGVCLGAQLLARGLGARVFRGPAPEVGLHPIALTAAGRADGLLAPLDGQPVVHWHRDTFELPSGARLLASSAAYAHQAYRVLARAYGVQFHPELDAAMRADWAHRGAGELRALGVDPASFTAPGTGSLDERARRFATAVAALVR